WDAEVYYDTTTGVSAHYFETTSLLSAQTDVLRKKIAYISQNLQHQPRPGHPHTVYYSDSDESDEDKPIEAEKSKINPIIREPFDAFLMGDEEIKFNPLKDIDDLVSIPRVSEKPLDSLDPISKTFDMTITNPLFDFNSKFTLNSDNPLFVIQNEESDESETESIMEEVQIHSSQSTAQIPPLYSFLLARFPMIVKTTVLVFNPLTLGL
ncbi:hypothetical protein Tco_1387278, partial [Tanacetum coccineum]